MKKTSLSFRAATLAVGNGTAAVVQMLIAAFLARYLTQADFGIYRQTYLFYNMVLPVLSLGLPAALLYFLPRDQARGRNILCENLVILALAGLLLSVFLLLGGAELVAHQFDEPKLVAPLKWFALHPVFSLPLAAVAPCLIAAQRTEWVAGFAVARGLIRFALVVGPVVFIMQTPVMAIQGAAATGAVLFLPGLYLMFRAVRTGTLHVTRQGIWEQLSYAAPLGIGSMIGTIHKATDKFVVASMVPSDEFAVFECGAMEIPFISLVTGSASAVIVPEIARLHGEGKYAEAMDIFRRSAVKCGSILIPIAGWFFLAAPWIMTYLYGGAFVGSATVFRIYLLLLPLRVAFFGSLFQAAGRSDLVMTRSLVGFVGNLILTIAGAHYFGPIGAAIGTVLSILLFAYVYCFWAAGRLFSTPISQLLPLKQLAKLLTPVVLLVGCLSYVSFVMKWELRLSVAGLAIQSVIYGVVVIFVYRAMNMLPFRLERLWKF